MNIKLSLSFTAPLCIVSWHGALSAQGMNTLLGCKFWNLYEGQDVWRVEQASVDITCLVMHERAAWSQLSVWICLGSHVEQQGTLMLPHPHTGACCCCCFSGMGSIRQKASKFRQCEGATTAGPAYQETWCLQNVLQPGEARRPKHRLFLESPPPS